MNFDFEDKVVIRKLHTNESLTEDDFYELEGMTDQQMASVQQVIAYVEANEYMEPDALTKTPFDHPQPFVRLFDRRQQMQLVSIIRVVRDNALKSAA